MTTRSVIDIIFNGIDQTGGALNGITKGIRGIGDHVGSITGPIASVADSILALDAALLAVSAYMIKEGYQAAVKYQDSFNDLKKVTEATGPSLLKYADNLKNVGITYGVSSRDALESAAMYQQAGFNMTESMDLVETTLKAVAVSELDAEQASMALIKTLKGFGFEASESGKILNTLNYVSNNYAASVAQLADGMAVISPIAAQAGFSLDEMAGVITPIIEVMQSGSEAGTALKTALQKLNVENNTVTGALKQLNIQQRDSNGNLKSSKTLYYELLGAMKNVDDATGAAIIRDITGIDQAGKFSLALRDKAKVLNITKGAMEDYGKSVNSTDKEVTVALESMSIQMNKMNVIAENTAIAFGQEYEKGMTSAITSTNEFLSSLEKMIGGDNAEKLFQVLRDALSSFSVDMSNLAKTIPEAFENVDLTGLVSAFEGVGGSISDVFDIDTNDTKSVQNAIQKIVDTIKSLVIVTDGMVQEFKKGIDFVGGWVDEFNKADVSTKKMTGSTLAMGKMVNSILPLFGTLADGISAIGTGLQALALVGGASVISNITRALGGLTRMAGAIRTFASVLGPIGLAIAGVTTSMGFLADTFPEVNAGLLKMGEDLGLVEKGSARAATKQKLMAKEMEESFKRAAPMIKMYEKETGKLNITIENHHEVLSEWIKSKKEEVEANKESTESTSSATEEMEKMSSSMKDANVALKDKVDNTKEAKAQTDSLGNAMSKTGESAKKMSSKFASAMFDISEFSKDERFKLVEIAVDINKEALDRKLDLIKADMSGLESMFESTGKTIVDMFDQLDKGDGYNKERLDFIDDEIDKREELFDLRKDSLKQGLKSLDNQKLTNEELENQKSNITEMAEKYAKELGVSTADVLNSTKEMLENQEGMKDAVDESVEGTEKMLKNQEGITDAIGDSIDSTNKMGSAIDKIVDRNYEIKVRANTEQARMQMNKMKAGMANINVTMRSTGNVIEAAVDNMGKAKTWQEEMRMDKIFDQEMAGRKNAMDAQKKMNDSILEGQKIQNDLAKQRLKDNNTISKITVTADGLEPELKAIMHSIFDLVKIEARGDVLIS